jgi:hypothetical protein
MYVVSALAFTPAAIATLAYVLVSQSRDWKAAGSSPKPRSHPDGAIGLDDLEEFPPALACPPPLDSIPPLPVPV